MELIFKKIFLVFLVIMALGSSIFMVLVILTPILFVFEHFFPKFHHKLYQKSKVFMFLTDFAYNLYSARFSSNNPIKYEYNEIIKEPEKIETKFNSAIIANLIKIDKEKIDKKLNFWLIYYNKHTLYPPKNEEDLTDFKEKMLTDNLYDGTEQMDYEFKPNTEKIKLIDLMFRIAVCDGSFTEEEDYYIKFTAKEIGMGNTLFQKIKAEYITDKSEFEDLLNFMKMFEDNSNETELKNAYEILKIPVNSSKEVAKKAYLKLAKQYHPDKVAYLGEEYVEKANLMIQKINVAYDLIEKE